MSLFPLTKRKPRMKKRNKNLTTLKKITWYTYLFIRLHYFSNYNTIPRTGNLYIIMEIVNARYIRDDDCWLKIHDISMVISNCS